MQPIMRVIENRRSVRSFDGRELSYEDRKAISDILDSINNPFGISVEFRLLSAKAYSLKSPVVVGEHYYVAAKVKRIENCEIAFGYAFESFCLHAAAIGYGTVMLASSLNRDAFERAMGVGPDDLMPVASPIGRVAPRQSMRERAMRKAIGADERMPFEELFFFGSFDNPLSRASAGDFLQPLEAVRLAPSAVNKQPWRVVIDADDSGKVHFFEKRSVEERPIGDIQKVDIGIALSHFDLAARDAGFNVAFSFDAPQLAFPEDTVYITSCAVSR